MNTSITPEWEQQVDDLFCEAVNLPEPERAQFVRDLRNRDARMAEEVQSLVAADSTAATKLDALPVDLRLDLILESAGDRAQQYAADTHADPLIGTRIHSYRIDDLLGRGGMGVVYRATHLALKKRVALKLMRTDATDDIGVRRFFREMEAAGQLDHPNVVRATDGGEFEGRQFLVMDILDGIDLAELVKLRGPLPIADACEAVRQAALGLEHACARGLTHRDIKPSNLFLTRKGVVKVVDFGLASLRDSQGDLTNQNDIFGTADFMAPEQWEDARSADHRADIYSLGCTLFHLLTGRPPFQSEDTRSLPEKMRAHLNATPPDLRELCPEVPPELVTLLQSCLAKRRDDRFDSHRELAEQLAALAGGSTLGEGLEPLLTAAPTVIGETARSQNVETAVPNRATTRPEAGRSTLRELVLNSQAGPIGCSVTLTLGLLVSFLAIRNIDFGVGETTTVRVEPGSGSENTGTAAVGVAQQKVALQKDPQTDVPLANPRPPANPPPASKTIELKQFEIVHLADTGDVFNSSRLDVMGHPWEETVRQGDGCRAFVKFEFPVYCYLLALNPDGVIQLCSPEDETAAPEHVEHFEYPKDNALHFPFSDGTGQQAFVLITSKRKLPPWSTFRAETATDIPWKANTRGGWWRFNIERLRGTPTSRVSPEFQQSCEYFKSLPGIAEVFGVAFPVE